MKNIQNWGEFLNESRRLCEKTKEEINSKIKSFAIEYDFDKMPKEKQDTFLEDVCKELKFLVTKTVVRNIINDKNAKWHFIPNLKMKL